MFKFLSHLLPSKKKALKQFAKSSSGSYIPRKVIRTGKIIWKYKHINIELEYINRAVGYYLVSSTRIVFEYKPNVDFDFIMHPHSIVDDITEWLGEKYFIKLNNKRFDDFFVLQGSDKLITRKLFSDVSVQYLTENFPELTVKTYSENIKRKVVAKGSKLLVINYPKPILNQNELESYFILAQKIIDRMKRDKLIE